MKQFANSLVFSWVLLFGINGWAQDIEHLLCNDYWATVDFSDVALNQSFFDFRGENDICHADSNESYPYDERISILIYNNFDEAGAYEEFENEKLDSESLDGYMEVSNLGDEAFAVMRIEFGKLDSVIIEVVKGNYTIHFDINGNIANNSNNRFTPSSVFDFARAIINQL